MRTGRTPRRKYGCLPAFLLFVLMTQIITPHAPQCFNLPRIPAVSGAGIIGDIVSSTYERLFPPEDYFDDDDDFETKTLNIVEISDMRAREIKRRLGRAHGYDPEELAKMIDKKDLINALSFEEHKAYQKEAERRKWIKFKTTVIYSCVAVLVVMFWPLVKHAIEVASVRFVVYTDRRKYEVKRCREFNSWKGYIGILFLFIIDVLSFWLSTSVLLSWVMRAWWFFPIPNIPIRPAQLLTPTGGDAGALGQYGINVGPMLISWIFRFLNGQVENFIGRAMAQALKKQKKQEKKEMKRAMKKELAREKEAKREAKRQVKKAKKESMAHEGVDAEGDESSDSDGENSYSGMTASNVARSVPTFENLDTEIKDRRREPATPSTNFDELD